MGNDALVSVSSLSKMGDHTLPKQDLGRLINIKEHFLQWIWMESYDHKR